MNETLVTIYLVVWFALAIGTSLLFRGKYQAFGLCLVAPILHF